MLRSFVNKFIVVYGFYVVLLNAGFGLALVTTTAGVKASTTEDESAETPSASFSVLCKDLQNSTKSSTVKQVLYDQCLPYVVGMAKSHESIDNLEVLLAALSDAPNMENPKYKIVVNFNSVQLLAYVVASTTDFQPEVQVQFDMGWKDPRLLWDEKKWNFKTYPAILKPNTQIWGPNAIMKGSGSILNLAESITYYDVRVASDGLVNATAVGQLTFTKCNSDLSQYPYDMLKCCADIILTPREKVVVDAVEVPTSWDESMIGIWQIDKLTMKQKRSKVDRSSIQMCINARRNIGAVGVEMSLPMAVSAIVLMCAQFAGKWKMQVYIKLFAILIQIFAFQNLAPSETLASAITTPKVYVFYNFTIGMTIFSLFQTMLFWALSRRWFVMPPPHSLTLHTKVVSRFLLGDKFDRLQDRPIENGVSQNQRQHDVNNYGVSPLEKPNHTNRKEWEAIFATLHAICSIFIIVIYIVGIIVIYASY